ncbi:class I SAM-dependent methyltransferase [Paenibacillus sp. DMB20]|uniref:class I SAM-dependent methyltransferase n=1 Tax=Paenibacillus sp. DMB20 TaxID=1642570 RepID=UPI00069A8831|nr:class I SAM-dependent methyltransferase [Paenibacillus sp. DMB20]
MKQGDILQAFTDEKRYAAQKAVYSSSIDGLDAEEESFKVILESKPKRILEVGCGMGEFSHRLLNELNPIPEITTVDISERMVELSRQKGLHSQVADVTCLPFPDHSFDCVIANWVLHYVSKPKYALSEIFRVLQVDGKFIATTNSNYHMKEIWELIFESPSYEFSFSSENGHDLLSKYFKDVKYINTKGTVLFENRSSIEGFIERHIRGEEIVSLLPELSVPFTATRRSTIFISTR